ncbi:NAD-dependent epimerase/dehydratase family protein [Planctomycetota bacterium]
MRVLVTGGAGFLGSHLALALRASSLAADVVCLDNLRRRGAELNIPRLTAHGVTFAHGDVRCRSDIEDLRGIFDVVIDASADPCVTAGIAESPSYVLETNLLGTTHILEFARRRAAAFVLLSTSRVYSIAHLRRLPLVETETRYQLRSPREHQLCGVGDEGIAESFPTEAPISFYGATKLASELLAQEYAAAYGLHVIVNRCGVVAGPGQFGKAEQGVFSLWVAHHLFGLPLQYTGFGGRGLQVRDLLHPDDLSDLLQKQLVALPAHNAHVFNVGGGLQGAVSLREWTMLCREATDSEVEIGAVPEASSVDIPFFVADARKARKAFDWTPTRRPREIALGIARWLKENRMQLEPLFR